MYQDVIDNQAPFLGGAFPAPPGHVLDMWGETGQTPTVRTLVVAISPVVAIRPELSRS